MTHLSLSFLGPFQASLDGRPITRFRSRSVQALLIWLAVEQASAPSVTHQRESLVELLWSGVLPKSGRENLRQTLARLRRTIPQVSGRDGMASVPFITADRHTVCINREGAYDLDVTTFQDQIKVGDIGELEAAVHLYRGDFLSDFYLPGSNEFEEWTATKRAYFRRQVLEAMETLSCHYLGSEEYDLSQAFGRRQLELDNLRESAHRQLIEALARQGRRSEALAQYEACKQLLADDLGVDASAETKRLVNEIRAGKVSLKSSSSSAALSVPHVTLPAFLAVEGEETPLMRPVFVARRRQLEKLDLELDQALAGHGHVFFICGDAGRGKIAPGWSAYGLQCTQETIAFSQLVLYFSSALMILSVPTRPLTGPNANHRFCFTLCCHES